MCSGFNHDPGLWGVLSKPRWPGTPTCDVEVEAVSRAHQRLPLVRKQDIRDLLSLNVIVRTQV